MSGVYELLLASSFILDPLPVLCNLIPFHKMLNIEARDVRVVSMSCSWPLLSIKGYFRFLCNLIPLHKMLNIEAIDMRVVPMCCS